MKKRHFPLHGLSLAVVAAISFNSFSLQAAGQTGTVTGSVAGQAGAQVEIVNTQTGLKKTMVLDQSGNFRFLQLKIGEYQLALPCDEHVLTW